MSAVDVYRYHMYIWGLLSILFAVCTNTLVVAHSQLFNLKSRSATKLVNILCQSKEAFLAKVWSLCIIFKTSVHAPLAQR